MRADCVAAAGYADADADAAALEVVPAAAAARGRHHCGAARRPLRRLLSASPLRPSHIPSQAYDAEKTVSYLYAGYSGWWGTNLQRIFPRKALVAVITREWFHGKMNPLVSLQIVVPRKALRTLITLVGSVLLRVVHTGMVVVRGIGI